MIRLCRKDFIISRFYLLLILPFYLLQALAFSRLSEHGYYLVHLAAILGMMAVPLILEDMGKTDQTLCSVPLARATIVYARYLYSMMFIILGTLFCIAYAYCLSLLSGFAGIDWLPPFSVPASLLTFYMLFLLVMIHLPFYFRYGLLKGTMVHLFILLALLFAILAIQSVSGYLSGITSALVDPEYLRDRGGWMVQSLERAFRSHGSLVTYGFLSAIALVAAFISMGLSIHFYNERDF
jgi:ABC-2 type transport system permease protein